MLIKLVVKIYSLKLVSVYQGYTLIVFMTQGYLTAERLRTTVLIVYFLKQVKALVWIADVTSLYPASYK